MFGGPVPASGSAVCGRFTSGKRHDRHRHPGHGIGCETGRVRRIAILLTVFVATVGAAGAPAWAFAPGGSPAAPSAIAGEHVCTVSDRRVFELSGLAATAAGYVAINDSASDPADIHIFRFDNACRTQQVLAYPSAARDPEDLALGADGTVWVADIGDNDRNRTTVAIWKLAPRSTRPVIHRLTYPDGPHDAEALLLAADDTPLVITKEAVPGIYRPAKPLIPNTDDGVPLVRVGELRLPDTNTSNPWSFVGRRLVTGAAKAPDGKRVVVRTYADAFEWDVSGGDVVKAITTGTPRITPLPDEPQGEAITYGADGASFITVSDVDSGKPTPLLRYHPPAPPRPATTATATTEPSTKPATGAVGADARTRDGSRIPGGLTLEGVVTVVVTIGGFGLLLLLVRTGRKRRAGPG